MLPKISLSKKSASTENCVLIVNGVKELPLKILAGPEITYIRKRFADKSKDVVVINRLGSLFFICRTEKGKTTPKRLEKWRRKGESLISGILEYKLAHITLLDEGDHPQETLPLPKA